MAKISANYEVVYIIDPAQGEEAVAATVAKFQSLAELRDQLQDRGLLRADELHQRPRVPQGAGSYPWHYRGHYAFHDRLQGRVRENSNAESDHHYGSADP